MAQIKLAKALRVVVESPFPQFEKFPREFNPALPEGILMPAPADLCGGYGEVGGICVRPQTINGFSWPYAVCS